ncbi:MAG: acetyl-CoA C-acyltransferase family protein [Burkholderiales bacterium]|nr:acetyl-CoA C-acyltransferase family protein [Burkholderiales bacterium]OUT79332.1 MAG: acetyl-CoA acetyltransferase [Betaproteobacteria bacterium TMED22]|tara:strand:+ start:62237 stop:63424 length:1188 start_codon:yes stop_codon:yes gene_type:complete
MADVREVVVVSGVRTAIGDYGGSLKEIPPTDLAAKCIKEALSRANIESKDVGHVVFGNVIHTEPKDMYFARVASMNSGIPKEVPALTLNRLCGTGLQAIVTAAQMIQLGDANIAVAGGAESMSRSNYWLPSARWGAKMGDQAIVDSMVGALSDPFEGMHMGVTAENVASEYGLNRELQDEFALESHQRASRAIKNGLFKEQILPIEVKKGRTAVTFDTDEHVRDDVSLENLSKLRTVFKKDGTVTAGNASGINDGAAALVLMEKHEAERRGIKPLAQLVSYGHAGVDPRVMGLGPIPAVKSALQKGNLTIGDIDIVESNEAFAAQACAVSQSLEFDSTKTNPNGGAVALGHPVGATGAIITIKALYELNRIKGQHALVTMCIGGGQGIAAIFKSI